MEVMLSGFDDGGWWLVVVGCRGGAEDTGASQKTDRKTPKQQLGWLAVYERERREKMGFGLSCVFWNNPTLG